MEELGVAVTSESTCLICYEEFDAEDPDPSSSAATDPLGSSIEVIFPCNQKRQDIVGKTKFHRPRRLRVPECDHEFCHDCLAQHCKYSIASRIVPVPCPSASLPHNRISQQQDDSAEDRVHYLPPAFVQEVLLAGETPQEKHEGSAYEMSNASFESNLEEGNNKLEGGNNKLDSIRMELCPSEGQIPDIEINRTFSTHIMSSSSSSVSSNLSCISITSLPSYWNKYVKIQRLKLDPTLLTCPRCDGLVSPPSNHSEQPFMEGVEVLDSSGSSNNYNSCRDIENTPELLKGINGTSNANNSTNNTKVICYPQVMCPTCRHCFCATHGDAHLGMTCEEFASTERGQDMEQSEAAIRAMSKRCSHANCGAPIVRISGCDHILCTQCQQDFCYKCGTHVHLTGKVIRTCSKCKQGFVDHRYYGQYRLRLVLILPFHLVLSAIYMALILPVAMLSCGFGCCFCCGTRGWQCERGPEERAQPGKGLFMVARVICFPVEEIIRDCGLLPDVSDDIRS